MTTGLTDTPPLQGEVRSLAIIKKIKYISRAANLSLQPKCLLQTPLGHLDPSLPNSHFGEKMLVLEFVDF